MVVQGFQRSGAEQGPVRLVVGARSVGQDLCLITNYAVVGVATNRKLGDTRLLYWGRAAAS